MPYFIAFLETVDKKKDAELLDEHKAYLKKYLDNGKIYAKGPFLDHSGGLIIYKVQDEEEAYAIAKEDPVIKYQSRKMILKEWKSTFPE
ncbi:YciI family protein [Tindallia californiensis]|uniref:YCII-related domain-containing protein n=1 Tax=Tindallia californiensis TaxID=159292 RepID=A0A1H3LPC3_9FIRM|nr:YciI family protein [Tindallia californiensis]SDY66166.1 hypothetical protein SAMN05192546_103303 [Tindallia californiensis]